MLILKQPNKRNSQQPPNLLYAFSFLSGAKVYWYCTCICFMVQ